MPLLYVPKSESEAEFRRPPLLPASLGVDESVDQKWKGMICGERKATWWGSFGLELSLGNRRRQVPISYCE